MFLDRGADPEEAGAELWAAPRAWAEKGSHSAVLALSFNQVAFRADYGRSPVYSKTSSRGTPKTKAIRKATSSDGEYLPSSMAFTVWRVTPIRWASSRCVISSRSNRKRRI